MSLLTELMELKNRANKSFSAGNYINACMEYAKAIERMMEIEAKGSSAHEQTIDPEEIDGFNCLKSQLFLNLGIANFNLNEMEGDIHLC